MKASDRYDSLIQWYAQMVGIPWELIKRQVEAESSFRPGAVSPSGAMGLMQLMSATATEVACMDPMNPEQNLKGGTTYMAKKLSDVRARLHGESDINPCDTYRMALASYNCGWGYVLKALVQLKAKSFPPTWDLVKQELPTAIVKGKKADAIQAVTYAERILPPNEDLQWSPVLHYPGSLA